MRAYKKPKHVEIIYFSGTGGTKRAAEAFVQDFEEQGIATHCHEIHKRNPYHYQSCDLLLVLYPVYALNAPKPVYDFIKRLPYTEGTSAVVVSISGGGEMIPNTASRLHCIRQLQKKGYRVVYEYMLVMPSNFITPTPDEISLLLLHILPTKVKHIVDDLIAGVYRRTKPHLIDQLLAFFAEAEKQGAKMFGKYIKADQSCNGCGICAKSCPTGNIKLHNKVPVFDGKCSLCLRCIYQCPKKALKPSFANRFLIKQGYQLEKMEKEMNEQKTIDINSYKFGVAFGGLKKYLMED